MDVIATKRGYYGGQLREAGDSFAVSGEEMFSLTWMKKVNIKVLPKVKETSPKKSKPTLKLGG